jgi:small-conductance mechanosensitive channel
MYSQELFLNQTIYSFKSFEITYANIILAIVILIFGILINKTISRFLLRFAKQREFTKRQGQIQILTTLVSYGILIVTGLFILQVFGVNLSIILASSAAILVGVGLGIQSTVHNFVSGISLMFGSTIGINDVIKVDKILGRIRHIGFRSTEIITPLDDTIIIPNSKLNDQSVNNLTHRSPATGFKIPVVVTYDTNIDTVRELLIDCAKNQSEILNTPEVQVFCKQFGENGIKLELIFWVNDTFYIERIKSAIRYRILETFATHKIQFAGNYLQVTLHNSK